MSHDNQETAAQAAPVMNADEKKGREAIQLWWRVVSQQWYWLQFYVVGC